jgi:alginate O-acetyltransferase complex protein AlgI
MSYDALYFAPFLAAVLALFHALPRGARGYVLLAASIAFYAVAGVRDCLLAAFLLVANYAFQWLILRDRRWLAPALVVNFGCLVFFKYRVFFAHSVGFDLPAADLVIPLGISFYVFQLSGFLIDLSRGRAKPFGSLPQFLLFKLFFGQLVAGPITRWRQFGPQVGRLFEGTLRRPGRLAAVGLALCLLGLAKKIVLADALAPWVDLVFTRGPAEAVTAWIGAWAFGFQIYYDFSGYSDIAVGLGLLFGIRLPMNFRQPYLARSPQEFWQRWHITLSRWIRDYLYIPLGGNSGGMGRSAAVLLVTMGLAGLWHGANATFIIWGLGWGLVILVWRLAGELPAKAPLVAWVATLLVVMVLWVFFRAQDLAHAVAFLKAMAGLAPAGNAGAVTLGGDALGKFMLLGGLAALMGLHRAEVQLFMPRVTRALMRARGPLLYGLMTGLALALLLIPKASNEPFIYFRF